MAENLNPASRGRGKGQVEEIAVCWLNVVPTWNWSWGGRAVGRWESEMRHGAQAVARVSRALYHISNRGNYVALGRSSVDRIDKRNEYPTGSPAGG